MLIQSLTTDTITLITDVTCNVDVMTCYIDRNQSNGTVGMADRTLTSIATAATTTIVGAPGASTTRNIKMMSIRNTNAFNSVFATIQYNANGTVYQMHTARLLAGESIEYTEEIGFFKLIDSSRLDRVFVANVDSTFATAATFADITGLQCPMLSGVTYGFLACVYHIGNATTTGAQFGVKMNGGTPTNLRASIVDPVLGSTSAAVWSAGSTSANDVAMTLQTTGAATLVMGIISGYVTPSADGTFSLRATSEVTVAAGLVVKAGSWLRVFRQTG
jgi:hypothetical protein